MKLQRLDTHDTHGVDTWLSHETENTEESVHTLVFLQVQKYYSSILNETERNPSQMTTEMPETRVRCPVSFM